MQSFRKTKIVATLGPASSSEDMIRKLMLAGVNVFRLNFSHGTHETHKKNAYTIKKVEQELDLTTAIMMDLQGPKIRIWVFEDGSVSLKSGAKFTLDLEKDFGNSRRVSLPHPELFNALKSGTDLLLDDGKIKLRVIENNGKTIETEVIEGGILLNKKGVNIPNIVLPINALTEKDKKDLTVINDIAADWVAISFVQTAEDISYARGFISEDIGVLAKIEKPSAVENIDSILNVSDAIMVARGDLGVELPYERLPIIQNMLIQKARAARKPVVVASQMLETMTACHMPTRAEVTDVACAVAQGADAVMLSAESASGEYPEEAVKTMAKIISNTEESGLSFCDKKCESTTIMADAVVKSVEKDSVKAVAVFSDSWFGALEISNGRPNVNIVAFTPNTKTMRRLSLVWGVKAILADEMFSLSQIVQVAQSDACKYGFAKDGDNIAIIAGLPFRKSGTSNLFHIYRVDSSAKRSEMN